MESCKCLNEVLYYVIIYKHVIKISEFFCFWIGKDKAHENLCDNFHYVFISLYLKAEASDLCLVCIICAALRNEPNALWVMTFIQK